MQALILSAFDASQQYNMASLVSLRAAVGGTRQVFDSALMVLRRQGTLTLIGAEGRHGLSVEERAAGIMEHGDLLLYVARR